MLARDTGRTASKFISRGITSRTCSFAQRSRRIVIRPLSRNNARAESRKGVRPRGNDTATAIFTASHPFLGYADVSPRLLTRRELAVNL